jgi:lysophospholipase L1-like esterase
MPNTQVTPDRLAIQQTAPPVQPATPSRSAFVVLVVAALAIVLNRVYIPNIHYDWLNFIPLLAMLYVCYAVVALNQTCGHIGYISRCLSEDKTVRKPFGSFLCSPWFRSMLVLLLLLVAGEFALRCLSYNRALLYERQGNLLFTPIPNQEYVEKISLTRSTINNLGLRGGALDPSRKQTILCLGDSVTYGYGVDDTHTYPAELQRALDREYPGRFAVLNGGVDAYPIPFMTQKFLYLWNKGIHPDMVVIGYSFNEGWLGHLVDSDATTKDKFTAVVRLKNQIRSFGMYNFIVENRARVTYNRMKRRMVPGTNFLTLSQEDLGSRYEKSLQTLYDTLTSHHVKPVFLLFTGFDGRTGHYDTLGPLQVKFGEFAVRSGIPLLRSDAAFDDVTATSGNIEKYFLDQCHMNENGTLKVGDKMAEFLSGMLEKPVTAGAF